MNIAALQISFGAIGPAVILALTAIVVMLVDAFSPKAKSTVPLAYLSLAGTVAAGLTAIYSRGALSGFSGMINHDALAVFGEFVVCIAAAVTILTAERDMANEGVHKGEYYVLLLAATSGMAFMVGASDLVTLFLGLELMSIPIYALAGYDRNNPRSGESSLKYFILGAFATGFLLYGSALIYGAAGSTNYAVIAERAAAGALKGDIYFRMGTLMILAAMAFKVSAVPFHMWTPDVYQGAPMSITGYMSAGVKAAAFISLARLLVSVYGSASEMLYQILWMLAAVTMIGGNLLALVQSNIKRMLAYSSIGHAGYLLIALASGSAGSTSAMLFYLMVYALSNLGAFAAATALNASADSENISGWAGLGFRRPLLGAAMALFMLSLAGIPPTAGFFGKFYLFKEAVDRGLIILAVVGVLSSAVGVYYYLRVIVTMYMQEGTGAERPGIINVPLSVGLMITSAGVVILGVAPERLLEIAQRSVLGLF